MVLFENSGRYELTADENNYKVTRTELVDKIDFKTRAATGEKTEKVTWEAYYGKLEAALNGAIDACLHDKIRKDEITSLRDAVEEIRKLKKIVKEATNG